MIDNTIQVNTKSEDLSHSFASLRQNARSLDDIHAWLLQHPQMLVGDITLPSEYAMSLRLDHYSSGLLGHVAQTGTLPLSMRCEITAAFQPNPLLLKETTVPNAGQAVYFKHNQYMNLDLLDWPLATVLVVADCIDVLDDYKNFEHFAAFEERVNAGLTKHFGSFTLAKLKSLYDVDLLPKDKHGFALGQELTDLLFSTHQADVMVSFPMELS